MDEIGGQLIPVVLVLPKFDAVFHARFSVLVLVRQDAGAIAQEPKPGDQLLLFIPWLVIVASINEADDFAAAIPDRTNRLDLGRAWLAVPGFIFMGK